MHYPNSSTKKKKEKCKERRRKLGEHLFNMNLKLGKPNLCLMYYRLMTNIKKHGTNNYN